MRWRSWIVAAAVVLAVVLLGDLARRTGVRVDLTAEGAATLRPETVAALRAADGPLEVVAASTDPRRRGAIARDRRVRDLLRELDAADPQVRTRFIDLNRDRATAEALGLEAHGQLVVRQGGRAIPIPSRALFEGQGDALRFRGEGLVVGAIRRLARGEVPVVRVVTGHGEPRLDGDLEELATLLGREGLDVAPLDLLADRDAGEAPRVPDATAAVLLVAPRTPLEPAEDAALRAWLARGGSLGVWLEPDSAAPDLLSEHGVAVLDGVAFDRPALVPYDDGFVATPARHPITAPLLDEDVGVLVLRAVGLEAAPGVGIRPEAVLRTSPRGWLERVPEAPPADFDVGVDGRGPVAVALAVDLEPAHPGLDAPARLVVVGDATGLEPQVLPRLGNPTFAAAVVRWLARLDQTGIIGRPAATRPLQASPAALTGIGWALILGWPLSVLGAGFVVTWLRRRR